MFILIVLLCAVGASAYQLQEIPSPYSFDFSGNTGGECLSGNVVVHNGTIFDMLSGTQERLPFLVERLIGDGAVDGFIAAPYIFAVGEPPNAMVRQPGSSTWQVLDLGIPNAQGFGLAAGAGVFGRFGGGWSSFSGPCNNCSETAQLFNVTTLVPVALMPHVMAEPRILASKSCAGGANRFLAIAGGGRGRACFPFPPQGCVEYMDVWDSNAGGSWRSTNLPGGIRNAPSLQCMGIEAYVVGGDVDYNQPVATINIVRLDTLTIRTENLITPRMQPVLYFGSSALVSMGGVFYTEPRDSVLSVEFLDFASGNQTLHSNALSAFNLYLPFGNPFYGASIVGGVRACAAGVGDSFFAVLFTYSAPAQRYAFGSGPPPPPPSSSSSSSSPPPPPPPSQAPVLPTGSSSRTPITSGAIADGAIVAWVQSVGFALVLAIVVPHTV